MRPDAGSLGFAVRSGAICGALLGLGRLLVAPEPNASGAFLAGVFLGWTALGALIGATVATIRNGRR